MIRTPGAPRSSCPINFGLEIFGDRWSLLILRDLLIAGKSTFQEFMASDEHIASNVLSDRLRRLSECGLIRLGPEKSDRRRIRYSSTAAAEALLPLLVEMAYWGATHDSATGAPDWFRAAYETDRGNLLSTLRGRINGKIT